MRADVAIIGGTGVGSRLLALPGIPVHVPTREGVVRARLIQWSDQTIAVISRHSAGHKVPPHRVNYRALALAVKALGVKACFSTAAVGSIRSEWPPETLAICADILDFTGRNITLFDRTVQHTPIQEPFDNRLRRILIEAVISAGGRAHDGAIYGCMNGPRFETPQEIRVVRQLGVDIVGMTAASEAVVMREIGVAYACLAIVTNYAAGFEGGQPLHTDVEDVMSTQGELVIEILRQAAASA